MVKASMCQCKLHVPSMSGGLTRAVLLLGAAITLTAGQPKLASASIITTTYEEFVGGTFIDLQTNAYLQPIRLASGLTVKHNPSFAPSGFFYSFAVPNSPVDPGNGNGYFGLPGDAPMIVNLNRGVSAFGATFFHMAPRFDGPNYGLNNSGPGELRAFDGLNGTGKEVGRVTSAGYNPSTHPSIGDTASWDFVGVVSTTGQVIRSVVLSSVGVNTGYGIDGYGIVGGYSREQIIGGNSINVSTSGALIQANFSPMDGQLTLSEAAQILGYDHFNWVSIVESEPYPSYSYLDPTGTTTPYPDPPYGGYFGQQFADFLPFYWDESGSVNDVHLSEHTFENRLEFVDRPSDWRLQPGEKVEFKTMLAGIRSDNSWDALYTFDWYSDHNGGVGGAYRRFNLDEVDPGTGGIVVTKLDVALSDLSTAQRRVLVDAGASNISAAPEPATLCQLVSGILVVVTYLAKKARRSGNRG